MSGQDLNSEEQVRAQIATKLTEMWARAVERPQVDEHSDFYFHGGNHFLAPVMIACINEEMGLKLTVADLEQARTISKLTDLIYFEQTRIDRSTVVPLRNTRGRRAPLFMVHGVGGNVLGFYSLAKCLPADQPVYGIQAQALLPDREAVLSLEQMAVQYVADMRAVSPNGPYHLLGFSFGGLVAYEIAQQLHAAGAEVGMLAMLDTRQPDLMRGGPVHGSLVERVYRRMQLLYLRTYRRKGRLRYLWRRLQERIARRKYLYAANRGAGVVADAARNVREINFVAGISYVLQPYRGKITLFRAENNPFEQALPEDLNWAGFAAGGVDIKPLRGDHGQILYEPGLSVLAEQLTRSLEAIQGARPGHATEVVSEGRVCLEI